MRSPVATRSSAPLVAALVLLLGGCEYFNQPVPESDGGSQGYGYGKPTLAVTVNGVHFGPATPDPSSAASLVDSRDSVGRVTSSSFRVQASAGSVGAACSLNVQRSGGSFGGEVDPIGVGSFLLSSASGAEGFGTLKPIEGEVVSTPQGTWSCTGAACNNAGFVLTHLDADHAEGYLSGTFASSVGGPPAQVVCSFYLPLSTYQP